MTIARIASRSSSRQRRIMAPDRRVAPMKVVPAREGELVGDAPDRRVEILSDVDPLHATWSRFGPRRAGAGLHIHYRHSDLFYVLEGELTVKLGPEGDETVAPAGTLVRIPPLVVHGFRNGSDAEVRYLNFHAPGMGFADYMRGLQRLRPGRRRPTTEAARLPRPARRGDGVLRRRRDRDRRADGGRRPTRPRPPRARGDPLRAGGRAGGNGRRPRDASHRGQLAPDAARCPPRGGAARPATSTSTRRATVSASRISTRRDVIPLGH